MNVEGLQLSLHLVSEHACILSLEESLAELQDMHDYEHAGPCTIRNHPKDSRDFSIAKVCRFWDEVKEMH